ncbi:hypothetical protein ScPMuIL_015887 [Solemya velum]
MGMWPLSLCLLLALTLKISHAQPNTGFQQGFQNTGSGFPGQGNTGFQNTPGFQNTNTPGFQNTNNPGFQNTGGQMQPGFGTGSNTGFQPGAGQGFQPGAGQGFQPQPGTGNGFQPQPGSGTQGFPTQPATGQGFPTQPGIAQGPTPGTPTFQPMPGRGVGPGFGAGGFQPNPAFNMFAGGPFNTFMPGQNPFLGANPGFGFDQFRPPFTASANLLMSMTQNPQNFRYSTCYFNTSGVVRGRADFRQFMFGNSRVDVRIQVANLPETMVETERGIHVHEFGDIGDACARVGPHFNPTQTRHGSQTSPAFMRHVGDLGNIRQASRGLVSTTFQDGVISLQGQTNINGRALVITYERDDDGQGSNSASRTNGNARTPIACCIVARTNNENWASPLTEQDLMQLGNIGFGNTGFQDNTGFNNDPTFANTGTNNFGFIGNTQSGRRKRESTQN